MPCIPRRKSFSSVYAGSTFGLFGQKTQDRLPSTTAEVSSSMFQPKGLLTNVSLPASSRPSTLVRPTASNALSQINFNYDDDEDDDNEANEANDTENNVTEHEIATADVENDGAIGR